MSRDFKFTLQEIINVGNEYTGRIDALHEITGFVTVDKDGEMIITVDDKSQPNEMFFAKDRFLTKIMKKIHLFTKGK